MNEDNRREQLIDIIRREFIGPDPVDEPGLIQPNGEEILSSDPPHIRYAAGILFPQAAPIESEMSGEEDEPEKVSDGLPDEDTIEGDNEKTGSGFELMQEEEEVLNLSNAYHQSAISVTAAVFDSSLVYVNARAGQYFKLDAVDPQTEKKTTRYPRTQLEWNNDGNSLIFPTSEGRTKEYSVICNGEATQLRFVITYRYANSGNHSTIYTFTLRNISVQAPNSAVHDDECFFQVGFILTSDEFPSLPETRKICIEDEDYQSNQLLYRDVRSYAVGHGCSTDWNDGDKVQEIRTEIFPTYEVKPIIPNQIPGVSLEMHKMSDHGNFAEALTELETLCQKYREWIDGTETSEGLKQKCEKLPGNYKETARKHISNCKRCCDRMVAGVNLLKTDPVIRKAFQYMNRAMLLQQLHYNLPLQSWKDVGSNTIELESPVDTLPDPDNPTTWYDRGRRVYGKWRPFQLAFVLINLRSMADRSCNERKDVDLIWFPTGGGKTEAYLGLSAYTIFVRKLMNMSDRGTTILMRYTLRLLTSQQYERAAAMICACELIRQEKETELGPNRITIGLWVGVGTTPNKMKEAVTAYEQLYSGKSKENPFVLLKCPWCGAQMGVVPVNRGKQNKLPGYKKIGGKTKSVVFQCSNSRCDYSEDSNPLPLLIVDEAIYSNPPTLLLGTVDKFAMLPFRPEAQSLFGIRSNGRETPPDLIIQDELHLISGPLGSMVGHYETMIGELCTDRRTGKGVVPKIIASTATISRAKEQCNALYNCGKGHVLQFPPSGIDVGDSFFAVEDKSAIGRKYVGILAAGASSYATTTIRLYASMLYAAKAIIVDDEDQRDPYWTNVGYFNSLRELGQAATWVSADIDEYLHTIYKRRYEDKKEDYKINRRYIWKFDELTSRISGDKIPSRLQDLAIRYPGTDRSKRPTDICLATNMISVGVDVPRLGLMTVTGQPKTTSEYIQATSRIGRDSHAPGIIFTTYNPGKPRDKSYYEQFRTYHSKLYCHVEPTSVTPFSAPLRERALHAILIGLIRLTGTAQTYNRPDVLPSDTELYRLFNLIEERVKDIDPEELENTIKHLVDIMDRWCDWNPQKYQDFRADDIVPLMYPAGSVPNLSWDNRGMPTPTSMRSVDASCEVYPLNSHYISEVE